MDINIQTVPVGPLGVNCYIISSDFSEKALIIDPGGDFSLLESKLNDINKKAGAVLITHCHFDHVMAVRDFFLLNVPVYLHPNDIPFINSSGNLAKYFGLKMPTFCADNELIEGDLQICGFNLQVIHTPGHTSGSVCFRIGNRLFTGDTLFKNSYGRTDFPSGSEKDLALSAKKLFALQEDLIIYPGHGEETTLFNEKKNNPVKNLF